MIRTPHSITFNPEDLYSPEEEIAQMISDLETQVEEGAFSLVELSIVLVILGLLTGAVIGGQSLIRASEMRAALKERDNYATAVNTFREKYALFPGDLNNAQQFWGAAAACPGTNATAAGGTCNGDADNLIELNPGASLGNEVYRFWQHLSLGGVVEGSYQGTTNNATATTYTATAGYNVPSSRLREAWWTPLGVGIVPISSLDYFEGSYGNTLLLDKRASTSMTGWTDGRVTPEEAWSLDTKVDDGRPGIGGLTVLEINTYGSVPGGGCTDTNISSTLPTSGANFRLTNTNRVCSLLFKLP